MIENKNISNRYNFKTYIELSTFNAESKHSINISMNDNIFYKNQFDKNKEYNLKITDYIDFQKPGKKIIKIKWDGEHECADKFIKIYKLVVNEQHLSPHKVRIYPKSNTYINDMQSTAEGRSLLQKKICNPGHHQGWYGEYEFRFLVDPKKFLDPNNTLNQTEESLVRACGIASERILSDVEKVQFYKEANKI